MTTESLVVQLDAKVQDYTQSVNRATTSTSSLGREALKTDNALDQMNKTAVATAVGASRASNAMSGIGRSAGQAGIQIQQFVGQIQGGQSALLALSQQSADLGFVLGAPLVGAVVGIGASIAGFMLPNLFNATKQTEELVNKLKDLKDISKLTAEEAAFLATQERKSAEETRKKIAEIEKEIKANEALNQARSERNASGQAGRASAEENRAQQIQDTIDKIEEQRAKVSQLNRELKNAEDAAQSYSEVASGTFSPEANEAADRLTESLTKQIIALKSGAAAAEIYAATQELIKNNQADQVPVIVEQINRKHELIRAERELREEELARIQQQKEEQKEQDQFNKEFDAEAEAMANRLDQLEEFALTREERLVEQYLKELEMLEEFQEAFGASEEDLYARRLELAKKFNKDLQAVRKEDTKDNQNNEKKKEMTMRDGVNIAKNLGRVLFDDNKAINQGLIVADTAAAVMSEYKKFGPAAAAVAAAAGVAQLAALNSASIGGGSVGGAVIENDPEEFNPEQTGLSVTSNIEGEGFTRSQDVRFNVDDNEDFLEAMADKIAQKMVSSS